jgi:hypothetical protein
VANTPRSLNPLSEAGAPLIECGIRSPLLPTEPVVMEVPLQQMLRSQVRDLRIIHYHTRT